jgi:hypothetical protein
MGGQSLDVAMGKTVVLATERKPLPIAKDELRMFAGVYDVALTIAITISVDADAQGNNQPRPMPLMLIKGLSIGHSRFYVSEALFFMGQSS